MPEFKDWLRRQHREYQGDGGRPLTQPEIAEKVGVSVQTVQNWEGGHGEPEWKNFVRLCHLFDADPRAVAQELGISMPEKNGVNGLVGDVRDQWVATLQLLGSRIVSFQPEWTGRIYATVGRNQKAIECYEKSLQALGSDPKVDVRRADILSDLGLAYVAMGQLEPARPLIRGARTLSERAAHQRGVNRAEVNYCLLLLRQGDFWALLDRAGALEATLRRCKDHYGLAKHFFNVAEAHLCQGNLSEALQYGRQSVASARRAKWVPPSLSNIRDVLPVGAIWRQKLSKGLLGDIYTQMGDLNSARDCYADSEAIQIPLPRAMKVLPLPYSSDRKGLFICMENKRRGIEFEETEKWFSRKQKRLQWQGLSWQAANLANNFADVRLEKGQYDLAILLYMEAAEMAEQGGFHFEEARSLVGRALCQRRLGRMLPAQSLATRAALMCEQHGYTALRRQLPQ